MTEQAELDTIPPATIPPDTIPESEPIPQCEESGLPADFEYRLPDGTTHYCSRAHLSSVQNRMMALGYNGNAFEPDRVTFSPLARPTLIEQIDWPRLAAQYRDESTALRAQLDTALQRGRELEGLVGLKEQQLRQLNVELEQVRHLLVQNGPG